MRAVQRSNKYDIEYKYQTPGVDTLLQSPNITQTSVIGLDWVCMSLSYYNVK